ncbi:MAG: MBL fold metallo-hydrolase [Candidatus Hodarchaeales archaeon]|jgi:glyoxylase-like metal-dependent hydrolase (beta-lactamase superfamily II)
MAKITKDDLSRFNGSFLSPEIILMRPMTKSFFTCNSLLFVDKTKLILDTGFQLGSNQLEKMRGIFNPDLVLFSHYHGDHVFGSYNFPECQKLIHQSDKDSLTSLESFFTFCYGSKINDPEEFESWKQHFSSFLQLQSLSGWEDLALDNTQAIKINNTLNLGDTTIEIIHLPGHSPGHCSFYESNSQILFIGDFDVLSKFGPWYGWRNTDIQSFRMSVEKLKHFMEINEISIVVPSHSRVLQKQECLERLIDFGKAFDERNVQLLDYIAKQKDGTTISEIAEQSFFYKGKKSNPPFVWEFFERIHVEKHVEELESEGLLKIEDDWISTN